MFLIRSQLITLKKHNRPKLIKPVSNRDDVGRKGAWQLASCGFARHCPENGTTGGAKLRSQPEAIEPDGDFRYVQESPLCNKLKLHGAAEGKEQLRIVRVGGKQRHVTRDRALEKSSETLEPN